MAIDYLSLDKLETYKLARELGEISWQIYGKLDYLEKKLFGFQFVEATDSVAANIAEGYGRFHFLDKVKFYYNARGSLLESRHWLEIIRSRKIIKDNKLINSYLKYYLDVRLTLAGLIKSAMIKKRIT